MIFCVFHVRVRETESHRHSREVSFIVGMWREGSRAAGAGMELVRAEPKAWSMRVRPRGRKIWVLKTLC